MIGKEMSRYNGISNDQSLTEEDVQLIGHLEASGLGYPRVLPLSYALQGRCDHNIGLACFDAKDRSRRVFRA
jgi:hypothetical protein